MLILRTLESEDPFKVLCGCLGLERFFEEEAQKDAMEYHFERGAVKFDIEAESDNRPHMNANKAVYQ